MPRKFLKRHMPSVERVRKFKILGMFGEALFHPALWHLNRRTAAGGVAVGMFCGLIPGPLQMLAAALVAVRYRVNLPLALATTLYTNPLTIVPLYLLSYQLGAAVLGAAGGPKVEAPPDFVFAQPLASVQAYSHWAVGLGAPLGLGIFMLAGLLAACSYVLVRLAWSAWLRWTWHQRRKRRLSLSADPSRPG